MRATKGYVAGLGTTGALVAAIACAFAILSAVVAVQGWSGQAAVPPVPTLDGGAALDQPFGGVRAAVASGGGRRFRAADTGAGERRVTRGVALGVADPPAAQPEAAPTVGTDGATASGSGPVSAPAPARPAPGQPGDGEDPTPTPTPGSHLGEVVTQAGSQVGATVQGTTEQLGATVGQVSPAAGQIVTQAGQATGGAVSGATAAAGQLVQGAGTAVGGVLGGE